MTAIQLLNLVVIAQVEFRHLRLADVKDEQIRVIADIHLFDIGTVDRQLNQFRTVRSVTGPEILTSPCLERHEIGIIREIQGLIDRSGD